MKYLELPLQQKADFVRNQLKKDYPKTETPLEHSNAFELMISAMLSPQTKDETTNIVTKDLFSKYPSPEEMSKANPEDLRGILRLVNYYKTKAERIKKVAQILVEKHNSEVPNDFDELLTFPGIGRKVANVIISEWFERRGEAEPVGFVVDTHVLRVSQWLKFTENKTPSKVELDLMQLFPKNEWRDTSLRMIFHGREVAQARNPQFESHPVWKEVYSEVFADNS